MNIKAISLAVIATAILGLSSCSSSEKTISYKEAQRYFVRNDVTDFSPRVITTNEEFDRYFGCAAVMGANGLPTLINFDKENALAIIEPETNNNVEVKIQSIKKQREKIVVRYKLVTIGEPGSYSIVPCQLVKVSKKYGNDVEFVKE